MSTIAVTKRQERIQALRESGTINGIESIEIISYSQQTIRVYFVHPLPGETGAIPSSPALDSTNVLIEGGVRISDVKVESANAVGQYLQIHVNQAGDYSRYTLKIVTSPFDLSPPPGFDPILASIDFTFKVQCPNDFDCRAEKVNDAPVFSPPPIDYLGKDYLGFRRLILNRMSALMPQWKERNPADQQVVLAETLAYIADQFSYYQDAVVTETYLSTARFRRSLKRHTHLLDYRIHEGCNARTWVHIAVTAGGDLDGTLLPAKTKFCTSKHDMAASIDPQLFFESTGSEDRIFESMHGQKLYAQHNSLALYTWSGSVVTIPRDAVSADVFVPDGCFLVPGDVVILEEILSPVTGDPAGADHRKRWAVRLTHVESLVDPLDGSPLRRLTWHKRDALPFALCLETAVNSGGVLQLKPAAHITGNIVLVDHGITIDGAPGLEPEIVESSTRPYRPALSRKDITWCQQFDAFEQNSQPANETIVQSPSLARAAVWISDGENDWTVEHDLLGSDRFGLFFVVEPENDGLAFIRFGDDIHGKRPPVGTTFSARFRVGSGSDGNVGAESIAHCIGTYNGIVSIRNPLPAQGGVLPETAQEIKRDAPEAFKVQKRAVTEADWEQAAMEHPEVQRARANFRWTGSWYTVYVTVDRVGGLGVRSDNLFVEDLMKHLNKYRLMGYDCELRDPVYTSLDIILGVCMKTGFTAADVRKRLTDAFSTCVNADNRPGFFHPDQVTFGTPVYISALCARAHEVEGVASVRVTRFQQWGKTGNNEIATGYFQPAQHEIIRCDSDPNFPEHGIIQFEILG
jgi:hypothetical protein